MAAIKNEVRKQERRKSINIDDLRSESYLKDLEFLRRLWKMDLLSILCVLSSIKSS